MLLTAMFAPLAMQAQGLVKAPDGTTLHMAAAQNCEKQTATQTREAGWLQYDDGTLATNLGASSAYYWTYGAMYPASMLGDNNTLSRVCFYESSYMITDVTIEIYSGGDDEPGDLLYSEDVTPSGAAGFNEVELGEAVSIDPTQNLWIVLTVGGTYVMPLCQSTEPNNNWVDNGGWGHLSDMGFSGYGFMIRGYVEYVDPTACPKPTQLAASDITLNTAVLSWNGEARSYQLVYSDREGFDPDSATPIDVNETLYTLTNLTDGTTYYAYVRANCEGSYSQWSSMATFTTVSACAVPYNVEADNITANGASITWEGWQDSYTLRYATPIFYDDFENGLDNWTIYTEGESGDNGGWYTMNPENGLSFSAVSGSYAASSWSWNSSAYHANNWLVSPQVQLGGAVCFYVRTNAGYPDSYEILLSTGGNTIEDFTVILQAMAPAPDNGEWNMVTIDLSNYSGQGYIAIHHEDYDMNYLVVDYFYVTGSFTNINNVTSPYALDGLNEETTYVLQIQGNCPGGTTDWVSTMFTTLALCQAPVLALDEVTTTSATISWEGEARGYNIKLNGESVEENFSENSYTFNNLNPGTYYTVEVQSNCGETGLSEWASGSFYTKCYAFDLPYEYGFETSDDMACWDIMAGNSVNLLGRINMTENELEAYEGDYAFVFSSYDEADIFDQILISPELNSGDAEVTLQFSYLVYGNGTETFDVMYSTTTADLDAFEVAETIEATNTEEWMTYQTTLPAGTKYVCLWYYSDWQYYLFVDDFSFTEATSSQTIDLRAGWNYFSTYIDLSEVDGLTMLEEALGDYGLTIVTFDESAEYLGDGFWLGLDGYQLTNGEMVMIEVTEDCQITLQGAVVDPSTVEITVNPEWTYIGYPVSEEMLIDDAMAGFVPEFGDGIYSVDGATEYLGDWSMGEFTTLVPGQGYMYYSYATEPVTFVYQTASKARKTMAGLKSIMNQSLKVKMVGSCKSVKGDQELRDRK